MLGSGLRLGAGGLCAHALSAGSGQLHPALDAPFVSGRPQCPPVPVSTSGSLGPSPPLCQPLWLVSAAARVPVSNFSVTAQGSCFLPTASVNCLPETVGPSSQTTTQFRLLV